MPELDLFNFFRWVLGTVVTIYATIITVQSLWGWWVWLAGQDKYIGMLRRYLIVHGLRLRVATFWGDAAVCVFLTVAFFMLWRAHHLIYDLDDTFESIRKQTAAQVQLRHVQQPSKQ